jgi:hypothetical protein
VGEASGLEAIFAHWKKGGRQQMKISVHTGKSDYLIGRGSLYPLVEATASPEEALYIHWKKRWPHQKKLYISTGRSDGLTRRSFLYSPKG